MERMYSPMPALSLANVDQNRPNVIVNTLCPGMVQSELARDYRSNALMGILIEGFKYIAMKRTEDGAIRPVLAAMTTEQENGKHLSDEPYENYRL